MSIRLYAEDVTHHPPEEKEYDIGGEGVAAGDKTVEREGELGGSAGRLDFPEDVDGDEEQRDGEDEKVVVAERLEGMPVEKGMEGALPAARGALEAGEGLHDTLGHEHRPLRVGEKVENSRHYENDGN